MAGLSVITALVLLLFVLASQLTTRRRFIDMFTF